MTFCAINRSTPRADAGNGKKPSANTGQPRQPAYHRGPQRKLKTTYRKLVDPEADPKIYRLPIHRQMPWDMKRDERWRRLKKKQFRGQDFIQNFNQAGIDTEKYAGGPEEEQRLVKEDVELCDALQSARRAVPKKSVFGEDMFEAVHQSLRHLNDEALMEDIGEVIVPPAYYTSAWKYVSEHLYEPWMNVVASAGLQARPDYSVGIDPLVFEKKGRKAKLDTYIAAHTNSSFKATDQMYFPFLMAEVDCGYATLELAEKQNIYNGAVAVGAVVDLFNMAGKLELVNKKILAFSVSANNLSLSIYAHYPVILCGSVKYCRRPIVALNFETKKGQYKWVAYHTIMNIYDLWLPGHIKRLKDAIDSIKPVF